MKEHIFLPKPIFQRHTCFPDFIGGYSEFPEHAVNREYATTENNLDRYYNLHIVLDGKGYLHTDSITYELTRGQGFLYGPGLKQTYHSDARDPWNIRWVHFFGARLEEFWDGKGLDEPWLFHLPDLAPVEALIERLLGLGRSYEVDDEYAAASALYELLTRIQTTASQLNLSVHQAADKIRAAANYVRANCNQPFTLEQAAAIAGYSPHYFSRRFNKTFGKSFSDFLTESRILRAKQLLTSTSLPVKLIALETGFSQTSYFSKCFREQEGITPLQFREMHRA